MPRRSAEPLQRCTLNLFAGDFQELTDLYPDVTASVVVRKLVRDHIRKTKERSNAIARSVTTEIDLDGIA